MKKLFVTHELALLAKEKGFDEPCLGIYYTEGLNPFFIVASQYGEKGAESNGGILAPIYQQLLDWLETEHNISIEVTFGKDSSAVWFDWDIYSLIKPRKDDETGEEGEEFDWDEKEKFLNWDTSYDSMVDPMYELYEKTTYPTRYEAYGAAIKYCLINLV